MYDMNNLWKVNKPCGMHCNDKAIEQAYWIGKAKRIAAAKSQEVREMEENNTK